MFLLLACAGTGSGDDPVAHITGTVTTEDSNAASADVATYKAFGMDVDGKGLWYLSSSPDATCELVQDYLEGDEMDPSPIWPGGTCNLTIVYGAGDYTADGVSLDTADGGLSGHVAIRCAMGDGAFEWGTRDDGSTDEDYFWTGTEWWGAPLDYQIDISGGEADGFTVSVDMDGFDGNYPTVIDETLASGVVTGTIDAEWCNLYQAGVFPQ